MSQMLRTEALRGQIDDLAHVVSKDCLADPLTKSSADSGPLENAVRTGWLPNCEKQPRFRELVQGKHKAYGADPRQAVAKWVCGNLAYASTITHFLDIPIHNEVWRTFSTTKDWIQNNFMLRHGTRKVGRPNPMRRKKGKKKKMKTKSGRRSRRYTRVQTKGDDDDEDDDHPSIPNLNLRGGECLPESAESKTGGWPQPATRTKEMCSLRSPSGTSSWPRSWA